MKVYDFGWLYKIKLIKIISFQKRSCQEVIRCNFGNCFERSESKIFDFGVAEGHFEGPKDPNLIEKHTNYEFFARSPRILTILAVRLVLK